MADKWQLARVTGWLGVVTVYNSDDHDAAEGFLKESLALNREMGSLEYVAYCLEGFAGLAGAMAQGSRGAALGAAEAPHETICYPLPPADRPEYDRSFWRGRPKIFGPTKPLLSRVGDRQPVRQTLIVPQRQRLRLAVNLPLHRSFTSQARYNDTPILYHTLPALGDVPPGGDASPYFILPLQIRETG
jgi:hypothetical protein